MVRACLSCGELINDDAIGSHTCRIKTRFGERYAHCLACGAWVSITVEEHYCYTAKGGKVDVSKKRWDHKLQSWVLDLPSSPPNKYWDGEKKEWVTEKDYYGNDVVVPKTETKYLGAGSGSYNSNYKPVTTYKKWEPSYPWDGLSMKKWPNTFMNLLLQYHQASWWREGKHLSDERWKERLAGVYKPEDKYPYNNYYGGYYGDGYDCEG